MKKELIILIIIFLFILFLNLSLFISQNLSDNSTISNETFNQTNKTSEKPQISVIGFVPGTFKVGDVQFNIKVQNNKNESVSNIIALVSGRGFSTYDMIPVETLEPGEKDYIIVIGNFKESGNITLTIKINNDIFYQDVVVINPNEKDLEQKAIEEQEKIKALNNLSNQLLDLKQKYSELETDYYNKKDDYDLSKVSLTDFKKYVNDIDLGIINENIKDAKAKVQLANEAYIEQKKKLSEAQTISIVTKLRNNALIFSTIAGALITLFALSELLRRKSENVVGTIKNVSGKMKKPEKKEKIKKRK